MTPQVPAKLAGAAYGFIPTDCPGVAKGDSCTKIAVSPRPRPRPTSLPPAPDRVGLDEVKPVADQPLGATPGSDVQLVERASVPA